MTFRYTQAYSDGAKPIQYGLIAEEVADVFPELAVRGADGQVETVHYETLNVLLLNEFQKQAPTSLSRRSASTRSNRHCASSSRLAATSSAGVCRPASSRPSKGPPYDFNRCRTQGESDMTSVRRLGCIVGVTHSTIGAFAAPARADEIWVAPTAQQDLGGLGIASNVVWPASAFGVVRLAWSVPDNLKTLQSAKVVLIPPWSGGANRR